MVNSPNKTGHISSKKCDLNLTGHATDINEYGLLAICNYLEKVK